MVAHRNRRAPGERQSKRWSFFNSLTYTGADMFHDTWHWGHRGGLTVWFLFMQLGCSRLSFNTRTHKVTFGEGVGGLSNQLTSIKRF